MRICIDAGHGGKDPGAVSDGVQEKNINLKIALKLSTKLIGAGYKIIMTRDDDVFVPLYERARLANKKNADVFVSIHNNAAGNSAAAGTETLYYPGSVQGEKLAGLVQKELIRKLQRADRGIKERKELVVLSSTAMPAVLVECSFLTNPVERKLLQDEGFQLLAAESIVDGIEKYFQEVG
ncbi:N-acetylmuramoyl-L-alanine amidase [Halocella sp. SP3-1]|uniref:N-acetylmuramoyl-L-alanine amidase family protein n=1 Tax=Halocella sp. SP3-1 TaxID=2382161 RepID=UPI000F75CA9C|nr:N-acetylmuramoyl-L-alanine amidase [Halocella sp. SP3-1]AZO95291.1 N-acetylmuramoyl-L-alanine amidase [Halocella sp. SP3-1]